MTIADPAAPPSDFRRDQWGRPLIRVGDKLVPFTRSSSAAKTIEDQFNLDWYARRNVAFGFARDPSLVARVLAMGGDPTSWTTDERKQVNKICEDAATIAQAHRGADIGTAVHRMTEMVDRGERVVAGPYEADIEAYVNALIVGGYEVDPRFIECRLVCDPLEIAGTADRILTRSSDRMRLIADIKTGATIDYGALGWAAQLATYAHGELYDVDTEQRLPTPPIDRTTGLIIHIPAGQGRCDLYEIDLVAGYRAAQLANEIRSVRRESRRWITALAGVSARDGGDGGEAGGQPASPPVDRRAALRARWRDLSVDQQQRFSRYRIPQGDDDAIAAALDELELEGDLVDDDTYATARAAFEALDDAQRAVIERIVNQAKAADLPVSVAMLRSERRVAIADALVAWVAFGWDEDIVRDLLGAILDSDVARHPATPLGAVVGALTIDEAHRLGDMARQATAGAAITHDGGRWLVAVP